jgi:hypothetical protein
MEQLIAPFLVLRADRCADLISKAMMKITAYAAPIKNVTD